MKKIILASASPRRKELLEKIGLKFKVEVSDYKEDLSLKLTPSKLAEFLSLQKAKTIARKHKNEDVIIISADTFVVLGEELIGKPLNDKEAKEILTKLSGKMHLVITGFTIIDNLANKISTRSVITKVYFKKLTNKEIDEYVMSKEPIGKAGAYGIQDKAGVFVKKIEGDFFNIIGMPLCDLTEELKKFGVFYKFS
ncbi:septum formation protein Maf [Candidatus Microgenomates bacterium]|nr:MAG: septum formation protein Maf [Candidatus Microgenomates bacterium]